MGYRHCGNEIYLDRYGRIRKLTGIWRSRDRWRGLIKGLLKWKLDLLDDHSIKLYAQHIVTAIKEENASLAQGHGKTDAGDLVVRGESDEPPCQDSESAQHYRYDSAGQPAKEAPAEMTTSRLSESSKRG